MITVDEPAELTIIPQPITFWFRGEKHQAAVSKTASSPERFERDYPDSTLIRFEGEIARSMLVDPCSTILQQSVHMARAMEDARAYQDRMARRRAKADLAEQEAAARRTKTARW
jgi:hypothetical protein